jgi:fumarate hydratase, class II
MRIALASDHAGFKYKERAKEFLESLGHEVRDFGALSEQATDYPRFIRPAAEAVAHGECERGIVFGGSGNGEAMVANRVRGIRCALCWNVGSARLSRQHNDANMLSMGQRLVALETALEMIRVWIETPFDGGRHQRRIELIDHEEEEAYRTETDSMGEMRVPAGALYGAQTARAVENFVISGLRFPRAFIRALGLIKKHAAMTNGALGLLPARTAEAIRFAAQEVVEGKLDEQFVVDVFQTGSGTSTNMNANEVIARRASQELGATVHPNDHVNCGQSSNDVIPSALHLAALESIELRLRPALKELREALLKKAVQFGDILKIGRTHLQDATPLRLGQEFSGYASQIEHGLARLDNARPHLGELALGGTAVGTGLNAHPEFARRTIAGLAVETALTLREAPNHFEAQAARDASVEASGALKTVAVSLIKIANDLRWLGSGPRLGLGELKLPALQPGSSIMPGKVNPVMCEMVLQVGAQVIGNDAAITFGGTAGNFELNTMMPLIAHNLLQSVELLANATQAFARRCVEGLEADVARCQGNVERSLALVTALAPVIGYDRAAGVAKVAADTGRTVRDVARELSGLDETKLDELLNEAHH